MKTGDRILVRKDGSGKWSERIFLYKNPVNKKFVCVAESDEEAYRKGGNSYNEIGWVYAIEIPEYIPYDSVDDFKDRLSDGLVLRGNNTAPDRIVCVSEIDGLYIANGIGTYRTSYKEFLENCRWFSDGAPCGKLKVETT